MLPEGLRDEQFQRLKREHLADPSNELIKHQFNQILEHTPGVRKEALTRVASCLRHFELGALINSLVAASDEVYQNTRPNISVLNPHAWSLWELSMAKRKLWKQTRAMKKLRDKNARLS